MTYVAAWRNVQVFIDNFSQIYPDYRERVVAHEAAHLLLGMVARVYCVVTCYNSWLEKWCISLQSWISRDSMCTDQRMSSTAPAALLSLLVPVTDLYMAKGYLMGVPVTSYSLGIGQEHVEIA